MNKETGKVALTLFLGASILFSTSAIATYNLFDREHNIKKIDYEKEMEYTEWEDGKKVKVFMADEPYATDGIHYQFLSIQEKEENGKNVKYAVFDEIQPDQTKKQIEVLASRTRFPKDTEIKQYILQDYENATGDLVYKEQSRKKVKTKYIIKK